MCHFENLTKLSCADSGCCKIAEGLLIEKSLWMPLIKQTAVALEEATNDSPNCKKLNICHYYSSQLCSSTLVDTEAWVIVFHFCNFSFQQRTTGVVLKGRNPWSSVKITGRRGEMWRQGATSTKQFTWGLPMSASSHPMRGKLGQSSRLPRWAATRSLAGWSRVERLQIRGWYDADLD